ncbi:GT-D fold domain-containing protein [Bacteroides clarus]|uniref:GT-D fold domain-containing protein n=1 Tax=Bacteroides clarus TaxID=626929 RepID=UPI001896B293|nr:hypothetical protein [Bacteroides clarus]
MNPISIFILKVLRKLYAKTFGGYVLPPLQREENIDKISEIIYDLLSSDKPCMIARFGSTELSAIVNYLGVNTPHHSICKFIKGEQPEWWWNHNIMNQMQQWSGFFPATPQNMQRFGELMINDTKEVDLLGSWLKEEYLLSSYMPSVRKVSLLSLEPFWAQHPWTRILKNKKVLVIHPFAESIKQQYTKKDLLFKNKDILPTFKLSTIKAIQSIGGNDLFSNWFDALNWMKNEMNKIDYDICLIGCGAYGFPLAAHAKRQGKKAIHLGGALQLLFGIRGKRWENPNYGIKTLKRTGAYLGLVNEHWCRPNKIERPTNASNVENGCYW